MTVQPLAMQAPCIHHAYMSVPVAGPKKALGVWANAEQHRIIAEAAKREHRSVSNFVLQAALKAACPRELPPPAYGRDLVEELFAERRADVLRG